METTAASNGEFEPRDVRMGVFGGVWVGVDGNRCRPASAKQAALLSLLMVRPGSPISFEVAAEALWPAQSAAQGRRSLRVHVSSLRKWLREVCGLEAAAVIETHRLGYQLNIAPEQLDWQLFLDRVARGRRDLAAGDHAAAGVELQTAVDMWADPFPELPDCDAAVGQCAFLRTQLELAQDDLVDAQLMLGESASVVCVLQQRMLDDPYRERSCEQLMTALYASGRQAAALDVFRQLHRRLRDDLGIEPGPQIRATHGEILAQRLVVGPAATDSTQVAEIVALVIEALSQGSELSEVGDRVRGAVASAIIDRRVRPRRSAALRCASRPQPVPHRVVAGRL